MYTEQQAEKLLRQAGPHRRQGQGRGVSKNRPPKIIARHIVDMLAARHSADLFVPECKTGPTWGVSNMQRIDAVAIKKSWAHPLTVAYEIKVTRNDFLKDVKWRGYLPFCNEFVFATAPGVVEDKSEIPAEAGWVACSATGSRLFSRLKSPYRDIEIPNSLLRYVLYSRSRIVQEGVDGREDNEEFWRTWLDGKQELQKLGSRVSRALRECISEEINKRDARQQALDRRLEDLADTQKTLIALGFAPDYVPPEYRLKQRLQQLQAAVPLGTIEAIRAAEKALCKARETLEGAQS